jgi:uncharacterized protein YegL
MKKPKTYVMFVLDKSGSMLDISQKTVDAFNKAVEVTREKAVGQETSVSLVTFSNNVHTVFFNADVSTLKPLTLNDYKPNGLTAMLDGIGEAVSLLKGVPDANDENVSFLVIVITDGHENNSRKFSSNQIVKVLKETQSTDRWSFAFQVPPGSKHSLEQTYNIPSDNIFQWEATAEGIQKSSLANNLGLSNYFAARSAGVKSVKKFYEVKKLKNISNQFKVFTVPSECSVKEFIEQKTKLPYVIGSTYYQLMKPEKVQQRKAVLIMEKGKKAVYGGAEARSLIGLPADGEAKVEPGNHSNYDIFVQSTSVNRKLPRGTKVLVDVSQQTNLEPTWDHTAIAAKENV